jgi:Tripartite tricarboxylate transporter TctB family
MKRFLGSPVAAYIPALTLLVVTIAYLATGYTYRPEARAFPVTVAWVMLALIGLDLVSRTHTAVGKVVMRWLNPATDPEKAEKQVQYPAAKQLTAIAWLAGFVALMFPLGILGAIPVYVFASMYFRGHLRLLTCLIASAAVTLFIYLLFVQLLQIQLYPGLLFGDP